MKPPSPASDAAAQLRQRLRTRPWQFLHHEPATGSWNMAVDLALLEAAAREEAPPTLRLYRWGPPTVSLGRFQGEDGIDLEYARRRGWDVVRRPTGGRAVLHHLELTYSVALPPSAVGGAGIRTSYGVLVDALNRGLESLFVGHSRAELERPPACEAARSREANCFAIAGECDTLAPGGKLVGSAQVRRDGALLQHGSILLDAEPEAWAALFGTTGRLITLRQLLGDAPPVEEVAEAVVAGFASLAQALEPGTLPDQYSEYSNCSQAFPQKSSVNPM